MNEHEKAKAWRESLGLTQKQLAEQLGYSHESIYVFESGLIPKSKRKQRAADRQISPWVWQRYKLACAGWAGNRGFNWK